MKYIYSAVFSTNEDGTKYYARIPDLPGCITTGSNLHDAIEQITDAASGWLVVAEDEKIPIPTPTRQDSMLHEPGCVFSLVQVDTIAYRALTDTRAVRKNVSLPAWMVDLADKRGINCSQVLQEGLTARFNAQ
jgi:predicted RNase H-like HicB family nuclease